jgi:hypothetical protein
MPQTPAEQRRQAYLHQLRKSGQLTAYDVKERDVVPISNPHLIEDDGRWRVEGEYRGHMVSRFVKPPPKS